MTDYRPSINVPPFDGEPKQASEVWTLRKGKRVASCHLWTHPIGAEARITVDGAWYRGEARRDGLALVDLALAWKPAVSGERLDPLSLRVLALRTMAELKAA